MGFRTGEFNYKLTISAGKIHNRNRFVVSCKVLLTMYMVHSSSENQYQAVIGKIASCEFHVKFVLREIYVEFSREFQVEFTRSEFACVRYQCWGGEF